MHKLAPLFSSGKDDWRTPASLFKALDDEFHFTIDLAADKDSRLLTRWLGPGAFITDALNCTWEGEVGWCNPPYSKVKEFVGKAARECATTVMLVPARTDTR